MICDKGFRFTRGRYQIDKDPDARLLYGLELKKWLAGDTLSNLTVIGSGIEVEGSTIQGTRLLAWISGGTVGEMASATFRFETVSGSRDDRTLWFKVVER